MALQKNPLNINFSQGVQTKTDPFQIPIGQFQSLTNAIFTKDGLQQKRNGFALLTAAPTGAQTLCTLNDGLVILGQTCESWSDDNASLTNAGLFQPLTLTTNPIVRRATSQTTCDVAVTASGLACATWLDSDGTSYYQVIDADTSQVIVPATALPSTATMSRVYAISSYFLITYLATVSAATHLQYIMIPTTGSMTPTSPVDFSTQANGLTAAYDGIVEGTTFYLSLFCNDAGGAVRSWIMSLPALLSANIVVPAVTVIVTGDLITVAVDESNASYPIMWTGVYQSATTEIDGFALNNDLTPNLAPTQISSGVTINELISVATSNVFTIIYENANTYGYTPSPPQSADTKTDYVSTNTLTLAGTAGSPSIISRGIGLGSKAIISTALNKIIFLVVYGQEFQPTYMLMDISGNVLSRLAYSNGGGYLINQIMPTMNEDANNVIRVGYLFADQIQAVNKTMNPASVSGVYAQLGINLATFVFGGVTTGLEIGGTLQTSGGFLWQYDGVKIREHGFNFWPEDIEATWSDTGGAMAAKPDTVHNADAYFYQVTYEWTDAAGQVHRSAPSVPIAVTTTMSGTSGSVTLNIPTLRQTYKVGNSLVRIVIYRWSLGQQTFYRTTPISSPLLNDPTVDYVTYVDTLADASIVGNDIIYTNGGVIENICAPASNAMTLWQSRLFMVDAEDTNLLWFSKTVIEATPVEMSDALTLFIAPTTGAQGSTGPITALSAMDDKLIIFKKDAIYYINGSGPDNTGANSQFSDPVFITSTVGCMNPQSIVMMPNGVMFQSDKGIWLLGRDLSTTYVGSPVETYTQDRVVTSALCIPATNQVRFTLDNKTAVMYDYFFNRWANWNQVNAVSSVVFQGVQTYLNTYNQVVQETPNLFLDVSSPVLLSLTTGWINVAGLQGFERFYHAYLLGTFYSPCKLDVQLAYNYQPSPKQSIIVTPDEFSGFWGSQAQWGSGGPWGGPGNEFKARFFPSNQKCEAFQVTINEIYDSSFGVAPGAGVLLSGMNLIVGGKRGFRTQSAKRSFG